MRILAFDTSMAACSVAVQGNNEILAQEFQEMARGQSEHLVPMIKRVVSRAGLGFPDLDGIAVTVGPGAFTGVRIGLSTARALALAANKPLLGLTSLETLAAGVGASEQKNASILAMIDSKRGDVFTQAFSTDLFPLGEPAALSPDQVMTHWGDLTPAPVVVCGDTSSDVLQRIQADPSKNVSRSAVIFPAAVTVARLAAERGLPGAGEIPLGPLYLRPPDVNLKEGAGWLRPIG